MSLKNIKAMLEVCIAKEYSEMETLDNVRYMKGISTEPMDADEERRNRALVAVCRERQRAYSSILDFIENQ